ncbi:O-antigen ligase family protein [Clostridium botulinum]|nr:O-antigen ligase family protein [Clostridium botulinum]
MESNKKYNFILLSIMILTVIGNFILKNNSIFISIFAIFYLGLIYKCYGENNSKKLMYYISFLFAIISLGNRHHYYIAFSIYSIIFIKYIVYNKDKLFLKIRNYKLKSYSIFIFIFITYIILSLLWAWDRKASVNYLFKYFVSITMMLMFMIENKQEKELEQTIIFFNYLLLGILTIGILEILGLDFGLPNHFADLGINHKYVRRIPVTFFHNPNNYAIVLVVGLITNIKNLMNNNKTSKYYYLSRLNYIFMVINMFFTRSRTSLITCILILLFIIVLGVINYKQKDVLKNNTLFGGKYILLGFIIFCFLSIFPSMSYYSGKLAKVPIISNIRAELFYNKQSNDVKEESNPIVIGGSSSDNIRFTLIYDVVKGVVVEKNYFGFGVGNSANYIKYKNNTHGIYSIHSYWFEIMADLGIFMFLYVIIFYAITFFKMLFKYSKSNLNKNVYYLMGICLLFSWVFLAFGPSSVITFTPFWISFGIIYSIYNIYNENKEWN